MRQVQLPTLFLCFLSSLLVVYSKFKVELVSIKPRAVSKFVKPANVRGIYMLFMTKSF